MAKLKSPRKPDGPSDEKFEQKIKPAAWVGEYAANRAEQCYINYLNEYRQIYNGRNNLPVDIVPFPVRLRGIQRLVTDPQLKGFWKKSKFDVIGQISGLYTKYLAQEAGGYFLITSRITKKQRDAKLDNIAKHLDCVIREISDPSVSDCFMVAFHAALKAGSFEAGNPHNIGKFLLKLRDEVGDNSPTGCRRMKTHEGHPGNGTEIDMIERGRFIYGISQIVFNSYKRYNHAVSARILNIVRDDLGGFTDDTVRQYMKRRPLPKWW